MQITQEIAEKIHAELVKADQFLRQGNRAEAKKLCLQLYKECPEYPDTNQILGLIYLQELDFFKAAKHFKLAVKLFEEQPFVWVKMGEALVETRQHEEALAAFNKALKFAPDFAEAHFRLGRLMLALKGPEEAHPHFRKALDCDPNFAPAHRFLAKTVAKESAPELLSDYRAVFLDPEQKPANLKAEMAFAVGQCLEKMGKSAASNNYFNAGKLLLQNRNFDWKAAYSRNFEAIKEIFSENNIAFPKEAAKDFQPVFIVGIPRTGSTLLEQILAGHSSVFGADETRLTEALFQKLESYASQQEFPHYLPNLDAKNLASLADDYRENITRMGPGKTVFVDKMLSNFHILGLLAGLFPGARFINIKRNQADTALSIVKNIFTVGAAPYLTTPFDIGVYTNLYEDLMAFWSEQFPDRILDVEYEHLVTKPKAQVQSILKFCGLSVEPACLSFFQDKRPVYSPSSEQVKSDFYTSSIGSSESHQIFLEPFELALKGLAPMPRTETQSEIIGQVTTWINEKQFLKADKACKNLLDQNPFLTAAMNGLGASAQEQQFWDEAKTWYQKSLAFDPAQPPIWARLGEIYISLRQFEEAEHALRMAIFYDPENPDALFWLASLFVGRGDYETAQTLLERVINKTPDEVRAFDLMLKIPGYEPDQAFLTRLTALTQGADKEKACIGHFALCQHYKTRDRELFIDHLKAANQVQSQNAIGEPDLLTLGARAAKSFPKDFASLKGTSKPASLTPVFIVGLPRTGSSLLERILSRHKDIAAADEVPYLNLKLIGRLLEKTGVPYPEGFEKLTAKDWADIGSAYLEPMKEIAGEKPFITDKMLSNGLFLGPALKAIPNARVIHIRRNAFDTALSIYSHQFLNSLPFTFDLEKMAAYYRDMETTMDYWKSIFPKSIIEVDYENLVSDPMKETKRLVKFIGLGGAEDLLEPHENEQPALTLSLAEVNQPVTKNAIGQGKDFAEVLAPFKTALGDLVDDEGFLKGQS